MKWISVTIIVLVVLFLFKGEIAKLIDRTHSVSLNADGFSLTTQTVTTPLGKTIISGPPTLETAGITAETEPTFAVEDGFKINWNPELWTNNEKLKAANDVILFLLYSVPDGYQPSISIASYSGYTSAESFMDSVSHLGRTVIKEELGASDATAIRTSTAELGGTKVNFIERIIYNEKNGLVYVASTSRPEQELGNEKLWNSTRKVLNSFRLN